MRTRKNKAAQMRRLLAQGPSLSIIGPDATELGIDPKQAKEVSEHFERRVQVWLKTRVKPLCADLLKNDWPVWDEDKRNLEDA